MEPENDPVAPLLEFIKCEDEFVKLKCGDIFRNTSGSLSFSCNQCYADFDSISQFTIHIEIHFNLVNLECFGGIKNELAEPVPQLETLEKENNLNRNSIRCKERRTVQDNINHKSPNDPNILYSTGDSTNACHLPNSITDQNILKKTKCWYCDEWFPCDGLKEAHKTIHGLKARPSWCLLCSASFWTHTKRNKHVDHVHKSTIRDHFVCVHCGIAFASAKELKMHTKYRAPRQSVTRKNFTCNVCTEVFAFVHERKEHILHSHGRFPYRCKLCGRVFSTLRYLNVHNTREHIGTKPYTCDICQKTMATKYSLQMHMRKHSGETPNQCPECGVSYAYSYQLSAHIQQAHCSAPEEAKHVCHICGKIFRWPGKLEIHMRCHTGEKPYQCPHCLVYFSETKTLKRHIQRIHNDEKPFKCRYCTETFRGHETRKYHEKKIHLNSTTEFSI